MSDKLYLLHVLSALHVGGADTGDGFIDQPVAREAASELPFAPGSSVKGVLRDALAADTDDAIHRALFGGNPRDEGERSSVQGALTLGDARLLCLPVRSLAGGFAWVSCPLVLLRFTRELTMLGVPGARPDVPHPASGEQVLLASDRMLAFGYDQRLYLGPLKAHRLEGRCESQAARWAKVIADLAYSRETDPRIRDEWQIAFTERFAIVSDEVFVYLCQVGLELRSRIAVVAEQLWYIEALPPEAILWGALLLTAGRGPYHAYTAKTLGAYLPLRQRIQLGGSATVGYGQCLWLRPSGTTTLSGVQEVAQ